MTTTTQTITDLCALIDAGDDSLLPILADALEDAGDGRAAGLRMFAWKSATGDPDYTPAAVDFERRGTPTPSGNLYHINMAASPHRRGEAIWWEGREGYTAHCLVRAVFARLPNPPSDWYVRDACRHRYVYGSEFGGMIFPTRSAAYLALAAALTEDASP